MLEVVNKSSVAVCDQDENDDECVIIDDQDEVEEKNTGRTEDSIHRWTVQICRKFLHDPAPANAESFANLLNEYIRILRETANLKNTRLVEHFGKHLKVLHLLYLEFKKHNPYWERNYLKIMESILTAWCNMILFINQMKQVSYLDLKDYHKKSVKSVAQKICVYLSKYLLGNRKHIFHVLLKIEQKQFGSVVVKDILDYVFWYFLVSSKETDFSKEHYCRSYLVAMKWKKIAIHRDCLRLINFRFHLDLNEDAALQYILKYLLRGSSVTDVIGDAIGIRSPLKTYFEYIERHDWNLDCISTYSLNIDAPKKFKFKNNLKNTVKGLGKMKLSPNAAIKGDQGVIVIDDDSDEEKTRREEEVIEGSVHEKSYPQVKSFLSSISLNESSECDTEEPSKENGANAILLPEQNDTVSSTLPFVTRFRNFLGREKKPSSNQSEEVPLETTNETAENCENGDCNKCPNCKDKPNLDYPTSCDNNEIIRSDDMPDNFNYTSALMTPPSDRVEEEQNPITSSNVYASISAEYGFSDPQSSNASKSGSEGVETTEQKLSIENVEEAPLSPTPACTTNDQVAEIINSEEASPMETDVDDGIGVGSDKSSLNSNNCEEEVSVENGSENDKITSNNDADPCESDHMEITPLFDDVASDLEVNHTRNDDLKKNNSAVIQWKSNNNAKSDRENDGELLGINSNSALKHTFANQHLCEDDFCDEHTCLLENAIGSPKKTDKKIDETLLPSPDFEDCQEDLKRYMQEDFFSDNNISFDVGLDEVCRSVQKPISILKNGKKTARKSSLKQSKDSDPKKKKRKLEFGPNQITYIPPVTYEDPKLDLYEPKVALEFYESEQALIDQYRQKVRLQNEELLKELQKQRENKERINCLIGKTRNKKHLTEESKILFRLDFSTGTTGNNETHSVQEDSPPKDSLSSQKSTRIGGRLHKRRTSPEKLPLHTKRKQKDDFEEYAKPVTTKKTRRRAAANEGM